MTLVNTATELYTALTNAQPGDTIQLAPGNYGDISLNGFAFSQTVTVVAANAQEPPVFDNLVVQYCDHLRFEGIELRHVLDEGEPDWVGGVRIEHSQNIELVNSEIAGSEDGNFANDGQGISVLGSEYITLSGNEFHDLKLAIGVGRSEHILISANTFSDLRSDGVVLGAASHVVVEDNTFRDFHPAEGDHPDMIQAFNNGATQDMVGIVIRNNLLDQGDGAPVQGIFIQGRPPGQEATFPHDMTGIVIEDNTVNLGSVQGIWVSDATNVTIENNIVTEVPGNLVPGIQTLRTTDASVTNNTAPVITDIESVGTTASGNIVTGSSSEPPGEEETIVGDAFDNTLYGTDQADIIHGEAGNDTVYGGGGNDNLQGAEGDDALWGEDGDDHLNGGAGADFIAGGNGNDGAYGGGGNDRMFGAAGDDTLFGDSGNDMLNGGAGADTLFGGTGNDGFFGGGGDDSIYGEAGNDVIFADNGNDTLNGGTGDDILYGSGGADLFAFEGALSLDTIADFSATDGDLLRFGADHFATPEDALNAAVQQGEDVLITVDSLTSVRLTGISIADLATGDILIV